MKFTFSQMHILQFCFSLLFLCVCAVPHFAFASAYTVTPLVIDKEMKKRDIITEKITLTNKEQSKIVIYPTVNEVSVDEGGTLQNFIEPSMTQDKSSSITSWLEIGRGRIELEPNEVKEVTLTIHINPEVTPGEYHAFIGFPDGGNRPEAEAKLRNGQAPGTIVRIGVDKIENQFLHLEKFSVDRFVKKESEGSIIVRLRNPGEDPVVPGGEIIFYNGKGTEIGAVDINTEKAVIEAGKETEFLLTVPNNMKMGKYKAFLTVTYGEVQTASLNDTAFFYVLPLKMLLIIFFSVLFFALLLALYVHRRYDMGTDDDPAVKDIAMYIRETRSESKDHDIDLSKKNKE
jgi:hypothetical protein